MVPALQPLNMGTTSVKVYPGILKERALRDIITTNFSGQNSFITTAGEVQFIDKTPQLSCWQLCKWTFEYMHNSNLLSRQCVELVGVAGLGGCMAAARYLVKKHLSMRYDQMTRGVLAIYSYGIYQRKYGPADFRMERIQWIAAAIFAGLCATALSAALLTKEDTFFQIFKRTFSANRDKYTILQALVRLPSSCQDAPLISNARAGGKYIDPISQGPINNVNASNILLVGPYALDIKDVLRQAFAKDLTDGMIHHLVENRALTTGEQEKFLKEVCAFLCIEQREFLDCWTIELTLNSVSNTLRSYMPTLRILARIVKFFELLPEGIASQHFREILMNEQREVLSYLRGDPMTLTSLEVLGIWALSGGDCPFNLQPVRVPVHVRERF